MNEERQNRRNGDRLLTEMHGLLQRIDERTLNSEKNQKKHYDEFIEHKTEDDENFKEVHKRITPIKNTMLKISGAWMVIAFIFGLLMKFWK